MIVLGIDPGTQRVGYGVVKYSAGKTAFLDAGLLAINSPAGPDLLLEIKKQTLKIIRRYKPSILSIEKLYFAKNRKTALQVAHARGVILSVALECGLAIEEFGPNEVKLGITGYGLSDKKAVLKMVRLILREPRLDIIDDASDALALAILSCKKGLGGGA